MPYLPGYARHCTFYNKEIVFLMFSVMESGALMTGVRRLKEKLLPTLIILMLTPFVLRFCIPLMDESEITAIDRNADFISAQYEECEPIVIESSTDFESYGFPGNGTNSNPYIIEGVNISSMTSCISISNVNDIFVIRDCFLKSNRTPNYVIQLLNVVNSTIEENVIIGGSQGIRCLQSISLRLIRNTICDSGSGLVFINSLKATATGNSIYGHATGVELVYTSQCVFSANRIYANTQHGLTVDAGSEFNSFTFNLIGWNGLGASYSRNAVDGGGNNNWFTNSWSDYTPPGPYNISGDSNSQDLDPIELIDSEGPWINAPEDIVMGEGSPVIVSWNPRDIFPFQYTLLLNGMITSAGVWIDEEISFDLQYLEPGDYNIILAVADGSGNTTEDIVFASVLYIILGDIGTELVAYASILSVVILIMILCIVKKRP
ncbi:MAG: hypothetical protein AM326_02450 [Candidatus Thorarchaeota archaeon SMTZ-45]|nr:MAG: hypothetical protein AM326_02450 [Candidatus Thorarchaeota archaeon SMTZ-45]